MSEYLAIDANRDSSDDVLLCLATITHATLEQPLRVVLNTEDVISRGNIYRSCPFEFVPPEQTRDGLQPASLRIENIGQDAITLVRSTAGVGSPPEATFEFVYASAIDVPERSWPSLVFQNAPYDMASITIRLALPDLEQEPVSKYRFSRATHPGLVQ
jgi:hypothetical protein